MLIFGDNTVNSLVEQAPYALPAVTADAVNLYIGKSRFKTGVLLSVTAANHISVLVNISDSILQ